MKKSWIDREDSRLLVLLLRTLHRWSQEEMADRARMAQRQISDYETGKTAPEPESLARLTAAAGVPYGLALHVVLPVLRLLRLASLGRRAVERGVEAAGALAGRIDEICAAAIAPAVAECLAEVDAAREAREAAYVPSAAERDGAEALLARLLARTPRQRGLLILHGREFQSWALAELCCHRSVEAAADDPRFALELAEIAGEIAERVPGDERWRSRVQGYCRPFLGNARRVASGLAEAERAFAEGRALWQAGEGGDPAGLLDPTRPLDLEASLRRAQRRFPAALALLDQAFALAKSGGAKARILLKRSATLEQSGDAEGALAALRQALAHVDGEYDPRQLCVLKFNLAASLYGLGGPRRAGRRRRGQAPRAGVRAHLPRSGHRTRGPGHRPPLPRRRRARGPDRRPRPPARRAPQGDRCRLLSPGQASPAPSSRQEPVHAAEIPVRASRSWGSARRVHTGPCHRALEARALAREARRHPRYAGAGF